MYKKIKYTFILILMLIVASGKIEAEGLAAGSYKIGDKITYNGMEFYVIADSDENSDSVTMLKAEPIKTSEVDLSETEIAIKVGNNGEYLAMPYYSRDTCVTGGDISGCTTDYDLSNIKQVVDDWSADKIRTADLKGDATGYSVRLITYDELINNLGYNNATWNVSYWQVNPENTPSWVYNSNYWYWTMSPDGDSNSIVWYVHNYGDVNKDIVYGYSSGVVRPVITLSKKVEPIVDSDNEGIGTEKVNVPNTLLNNTILWLIIGIIAIIISVIIIYIVIKGRRQRK